MVQLCERNLGRRQIISWGVQERSKKDPFRKGCMSSGALLCLLEDSKSACFRDPWKQLHSGRSRPQAWEKQNVYTCHEDGGGKKRKPEQSPKLLYSSREGAAGRSFGRWKRRGRGSQRRPRGCGNGLHFSGRCPGRQRGICALWALPTASPHPPRKRAEPKSGARRPAEPAPFPSPQSQAPRQAGAPDPDKGPASGPGRVPAPCYPARLGKRSGGAYLARSGRPRWAWLRGPGSNWLPGEGPASPTRSWWERKAGCSQPCQRSSAMDAHPEFQRCRGTPIPLPSALFRRRRLHLLLRRDPPPTPHTLPSCSGGTAAADTSLPGAGG